MKVLQGKGGALHGGTEPVNVIKRDRKRITQNKRYVAPPGETSNCEKCGIKHIPKRCPAYNAICHNCKLKGHYRKQCTKAVVVNVEPNVFCGVVKTAEKYVKISSVSDHKWTHPLNINGSILSVKIDTGAGADLMNYNDFLS